MPKVTPNRVKYQLSIPTRLKRRVQLIAQDKGISMNDLILHALQDYIDRTDGTYQNADLVADRLTQVLQSQMAVVAQMNRLTQTVQQLKE